MASVVEICNKALSLIGQKIIVSLDDNSAEALACRTLWPDLRDRVLRSHPWNCATERISLNKLLETPPYGYRYYYQLPSDFLRLNEIEPSQFFVVEGSKILADSESLSISYVKRLEDSSSYDSELADAFSFLLASELCYQMTSSTSLMESLNAKGEKKLSDAKASNAFEGKRPDTRSTSWLSAQQGSV